MPVPATIEVCEKYLFADINEMTADGIRTDPATPGYVFGYV